MVGADDVGFGAVRPLTKRKKDTQELYRRREEVERQIGRVGELSNADILGLLQMTDRSGENYLFDETIVYLLRERHAADDRAGVNELYLVLNARIVRLLGKFRGNFAEPADLEDFVQKVSMGIVEKVFKLDSDIADYAQVNFGDFVVMEARGARRGRLASVIKENQYIAAQRDGDEDGPDPISEINSGEASVLERMIAKEAIKRLPEHLKMVAILLADGWKIESRDAAEPTISRYMNVSSRTIRNWVNEAREMLGEYRGELR